MNGHPCAERLLLPEALDGRLEPAEEKRVIAHLQTCVACQDAAADIETALISLAVLRDEREHPMRAGDLLLPSVAEVPSVAGVPSVAAVPSGPAGAVTRADAGSGPAAWRWPVRLLAAAAAVILLAGGAFVGRALLPPRDSADFGPPSALTPPAGAPDQAARGTVAVAAEGASLLVRLDVTALPTSGWYECVWVSGGQTRSAGSFRATDGVAKDVRLRVAEPQDSTTWGLQLVHHQGTATDVVLEGSASYHP